MNKETLIALLTLVGTAAAFLLGLFQWIDTRRHEEQQRRFEQFHRAFEWVAGRTATGQLLVDTQQAMAVYELGLFPEYRDMSLPIIEYYLEKTAAESDGSLFRRALLVTKHRLVDDVKKISAHERPNYDPYEVIRLFAEKRVKELQIPAKESYDGFVLNYEFDFVSDSQLPGQGHQGASEEIVSIAEPMLATEFKRRGPDSIAGFFAEHLPPGYRPGKICFRIIFDHHGEIVYLQHISGQAIGPDGKPRPVERVLRSGE